MSDDPGTGTGAPTSGDAMTTDWLQQAFYDLLHPKPPGPVCECGSLTAVQYAGGVGFKCHRGHRLPGQDLPPELLDL